MSRIILTAEVVEEHKVNTGETLAGIAEGSGFTRDELAEFKRQTSDPERVDHSKKHKLSRDTNADQAMLVHNGIIADDEVHPARWVE